MSSWLKFSSSNLQAAASEQELEVYHLSERQQRNDSEHWSLHPDIHVVHADLFFQKTLQQMLKSERYWEKTVWVLPKMNFSHEHEPHQIQNMDFIDMFHVLQRGLWGPANMETLSRNPAVTQHGVLLKQCPGLPSCCYFPQCVLWGVSPHLVGRVQGFRNARLAISVLLSTAESVHLCQLMCPNFTVTCEPSHAKRSSRLLLHIPIQKTYSLPRDNDFKRKMRCGHLIIRVSFLKCKLDNSSPMAVSCSAITMGRKDQALLQITRQRREIQWAEPSTELHKPLSVALRPELKTREKHSQDLQSHPASPSPDWCISSPVSWNPQPEPANSPPSCRLIVKKTKLLSEPDKLGCPTA